MALLRDPDLATEAAHAEIGRVVADRAALLERYRMVVATLERKGGDPEVVAEPRAYRDAILLAETLLSTLRAIARAVFDRLTRADDGLAGTIDPGVIVIANFVCRLLVRTEVCWTLYADLTHRVAMALAKAGLSIPYPQQDVHRRTAAT
jgi:small conductance mechanosensitive channel